MAASLVRYLRIEDGLEKNIESVNGKDSPISADPGRRKGERARE